MASEIVFPSRRLDGRPLSTSERETPHFAGLIELPATREVREHTGRVVRFSGWYASRDPERGTVRILVGDREPVEVELGDEWPEVEWVMAHKHGMDFAWGFQCFVRLDGLHEPTPATVELSDGESVVSFDYLLLPDKLILALDTYVGDPPILEELSRRHLRGRGLEFGALHSPVVLDESCEIAYADRMSREASIEMYDEMEPFADRMVAVDHLVDLDRDDLSALEPFGYDFFVAAGVIEHLVNPLRFLDNLHRIMKPDAVFLLAVPERDFTWDCNRDLTTIEHLREEYDRDVKDLSDDHLIEYMEHLSLEPPSPELLEFHRQRSIHVHVWDEHSFDELLRYANNELGIGFEVVERAGPDAAIGNVIYVLRKPG